MLLSREILVASVVAIFLIGGSFYVNASSETVKGEVTLVNQPPERQYIESPDSDGDGISDWAEELLKDREYISEQLADPESYELPETLTGQFSIKFFHDYFVSKGLGNAFGTKEEMAEQAVLHILEQTKDPVYYYSDITLAPEDNEASIRQYANRIVNITVEHTDPKHDPNRNELDIFARALDTENPRHLEDLDPIIRSYEAYLRETLATPVPESFARHHLDLVNVYSGILSSLTAMRNVFEDPLLGLIQYKRYEQNVAGLFHVYFSYHTTLRQTGIVFGQGEAGAAYADLKQLKETLNALGY